MRKQYLVDRGYQLQFVNRLLTVIFAISTISSLLAFGILYSTMYRQDLENWAQIVSVLLGVSVTLALELLVSIPIVYHLGIRQTHRVVGPLKRMVHALEAIGSGDFSPRLVLREGDVLQDLAKSINQMAENLQQRFPTPPSGSTGSKS